MSQQFIRGSQISFHYIRMFFQSIRHIFTLSFITLIFCFAVHLYLNANWYAFNPILFVKYLTSKTYAISAVDHVVVFQAPSGKILTISIQKYIAWYETEILPKVIFWLKDAFFYGLRWFIISFFLITTIFFYKGKKQKENKHLRGAKITSASALSARIIAHNLKHLHFNPYKLANIPFPYNSEHQHTLITGGSGTGKTQMILDLVEQIRNKGHKAIIYDRMGTYIRKFYDPNKDVILNPYDARSQKWSFFAEGSSRNIFDNMTTSLIEEGRADPFWAKAARTIVSEAALILTQEGKLSNKILCDTLLKTSGAEFAALFKNSNAAAIADDASEKTIASIRSVIATYIKPLELLQDSENYFSIKKWVRNYQQDSILFLSSRIDSHETIKPLLTLWLDLAISQLMMLDQEQKRTVWFIIDEMPSLQKVPILTTGLAESRQFGGAFVISAQLISQLREIYGRDGSQTISGLCRNRATFATPDEETAAWCSSNLGKKEILNTKENISFGASELRDGVNIYHNKETESLVIPSEIMGLKNLELYLKFSSDFPAAKTKIPYQEREDVAKKFIEPMNEQTPIAKDHITKDEQAIEFFGEEPELEDEEIFSTELEQEQEIDEPAANSAFERPSKNFL